MTIFSLNKAQYITAGAVVTIGLALSMLFAQHAVVRSTFLVLYIALFGFLLGSMIVPKEADGWKLFFGSLTLFSAILILLSAIYLVTFFSIYILVGVLAVVSATVLGMAGKKPLELAFSFSIPKVHWLHAALFVGYGLLFWRLFSRRLGDTLISPWTLFGPKFFFLFFLTTYVLLYLARQEAYRKTTLFFILIQYTLTTGVLLIVYKHGFGFDPFIHQTAEALIQRTGAITPKQPYYIGQYMLTLLGTYGTQLSIPIIDRALVPLLASTALPLAAYRVFRDKIQAATLLPALILLPILPLSFFTFTTPNNLALVIAAVVFLLILHTSQRVQHVGLALSVLCCAIHPFIGIPTLIVHLGSRYWRKKNTLLRAAYGALAIFTLPIVLWLNSIRLGETVTLHNPLLRLEPFLTLFQKPHWFLFEDAPVLWQALYAYRLAIIPLLLLLILAACWKRRNEMQTRFFMCSAVALFISGFVLSTVISFPNVISYEQAAYGSRMIHLSLMLLLPLLLYGIADALQFLERQRIRWFVITIVASILLLTSWYFTYPTRDPISLYTGYAVRDADLEAVRFIAERNEANNYVVLSNQTISAAAIKEKGFFQYHDTALGLQYAYAVPTGGPLYQYFRKMVYEEPKRQWMEQAMEFADVDRAYFVHTNYWAPAAELRDAAKAEADDWWELGDGRVWVYEYIR